MSQIFWKNYRHHLVNLKLLRPQDLANVLVGIDSGIFPKRTSCTCVPGELDKNIHDTDVSNSKKLEATLMPISRKKE